MDNDATVSQTLKAKDNDKKGGGQMVKKTPGFGVLLQCLREWPFNVALHATLERNCNTVLL